MPSSIPNPVPPDPRHAAPSIFRQSAAHLRHDGVAVALAFIWRALFARLIPPARDAGERAAERFLHALGYRIVSRNWRSPRDARDEADLIALTPDRTEVVIFEVKRAAGPWDALARVDRRKKEVLWRLLCDLENISRGALAPPSHRIASALRSADVVRVDLIGVRGEGRSACVVDHDTGIFLRPLRGAGSRRPP